MKIIVGYVPTPEGQLALTRAIVEAQAHQAELLVINASHGDRYVDPHFAAEGQLDQIRRELDDSGISYEIRQPVRGMDAADELARAARNEEDVEMVVIGLRHRSAVGKFLLGSTSQQILLHAPCPVLAVKT